MRPRSPYLQEHPTSELSSFALIENAYEAAAEPNLWPRWFEDLASNLDHHGSNLILRGFGPTRYVCLDTPEAGFTTLNPSQIFETKALSRHGFAIAWVGGEIVNEWSQLRPARPARQAREECSALTAIEVFTNESQPLGPSERRLLQAVLPHLHRALTLHFRLDTARREQDTFNACLDEFCTGMLLLDGHAALLHANRAALDYFDGYDGIGQDEGRLRLSDRDTDARFRAHLRAALSDRRRALTCLKLRNGATLWLRGLGPDRAVAYIASDQQERSLAPELLANAFELTPAESRVGSLFAQGHNVDEIAATLELSIHTVRLHIKKMQHKTGTHRQATLLRRMLETVPLVGP